MTNTIGLLYVPLLDKIFLEFIHHTRGTISKNMKKTVTVELKQVI